MSKSTFIPFTSAPKDNKKDLRIRELEVAFYDLYNSVNEMDKLYRFHYKPEYKDAVNAINYIAKKAESLIKEHKIEL